MAFDQAHSPDTGQSPSNQNVTRKPSPITAAMLAELRSALNGRVIAPGDPHYDKARSVFMGGIDRRPGVILRPTNAREVAYVVSFARDNGLELAIRSGGHSSLGHGLSEGGVVLDLAELRALQIDPRQRSAWAESGLTAGEYTLAAGAHGLATGFGDTASVGIGGLTLGGGIGYLVRAHGLTIDNLLAAELVTADGQLRRADPETHPDLFWALRGGGGNFGVVTRFQFRLHPVDTIYGGLLVLPARPEVIAGFIAEAEAAPDELSTIANVMPAPPMPFLPPEQHGRLVALAIMAYTGPVEHAESALLPFRKLADPLADLLRPMRYPEIYPPDAGDYHPTAVGETLFVPGIDQGLAETIVDRLHASEAVMRVAQLRVLGGAMSRVPVEATAFAHRGARIMVNLAAFYTSPTDQARQSAWVAGFAAALQPGAGDAYVNFISADGEAQVRRAYPAPTFTRLAQIKQRYDPTNLFHLNHNIPPSGAA